jgi:hypothetical protein
MPVALLLAMQAAGMIVDYLGTRNQQKLADMGAKIQQAGIESNIEQSRLETEDATLQSLKSLRQTLGSQIALFAARGTSTGAGSAVSMMQEALGEYSDDERTRRLNQRGRENALKANMTISKLNQQGANSKLWSGFAQRTLEKIPTSFDFLGGTKKTAIEKANAFGLSLRNI